MLSHSDFICSANVGIVALSDFSQDGPDTFSNDDGTIIGWGRNENGLIQNELQKAGVDILTREGECVMPGKFCVVTQW